MTVHFLSRMIDNYSISVIVPVYNEVQLIDTSIEYIFAYLERTFSDFEVILIESGSTDGTYEKCDNLPDRYKNIRVIHEGKRNGYGSALRLGYKSAEKDLVWHITLDLPFSLDSIHHAVEKLDENDCVLSYRSEDERGVLRKLQSFTYNNLVKFTLGLKVKHVNSAFKVFKTPVIKSMKLISNGWLIDSEILYRVKQQKLKYAEIPVKLIDRKIGESSVKLTTSLSLLRELFYKNA
jgi:glycosyltransferase involved in cell wall biosynthesis